ncbi:thioredoxin domain-containing protein [Caballeronia sp. dw_19]|uniref:thioredoxin domain-containing protein n=1 Tax=Caballeronia sp. dw_19 TaxID=2719791 RepID=UPI001BD50CEC|nr:thioredoxin domain-containing protein [Caballeronia sp. dw_19]
MSEPSSDSSAHISPILLVACLCARWCRTCDTYRATLNAVRAELRRTRPHAHLRFLWIDIEDEAALIGDLDIENFPTILLASDEQGLFLGPVMPHAAALDRLILAALDGDLPPVTLPEGDAATLPARLAEHTDL